MNELQYNVLLDSGDYMMHLCLSLLMIQFLFGSWVYSLFVTKLYNQENISETLKPSLLYWFFFEIVLACFFIALETISGTNIFGAVAGDKFEDIFSLGYLSILLVLRGELKPSHL